MTGDLLLRRLGADAEPLYTNAAGGIWLSPPVAVAVPADLAWVGIQELHHAAIGDRAYSYVTEAESLDAGEALVAYSNAVVGVLGQMAVTSPLAVDNMLASLTNHIDLYGSMDGLEATAYYGQGVAVPARPP